MLPYLLTNTHAVFILLTFHCVSTYSAQLPERCYFQHVSSPSGGYTLAVEMSFIFKIQSNKESIEGFLYIEGTFQKRKVQLMGLGNVLKRVNEDRWQDLNGQVGDVWVKGNTMIKEWNIETQGIDLTFKASDMGRRSRW